MRSDAQTRRDGRPYGGDGPHGGGPQTKDTHTRRKLMFINEVFDVRDLRDVELDRAVDIGRFFPLNPNIKILVVVDTEIDLDLGAGSFGVGRVVQLLRNTSVGCTSFTVDIAIRDPQPFSDNANPAVGQARYRGFRFDSMAAGGAPVIDGYHELFLFGFKPNNFGSTNDAVIDDPNYIPATNAELSVLEAFMRERKGGVFGTGDHHFLGASMCRRIPRLGTMRRWTNADNVPTFLGNTRLDTNQPANAAQAGGAFVPRDVERDAVPQPIQWIAHRRIGGGLIRRVLPHPILCHPTHGPIDVMPDHPHEGRVRTAAEINLNATYDFGTGTHDEYPNVGGSRLEPQVIAWGNTTPDPPLNHDKGEQPAVRFPMIGVYDGHQADIGRVVTDSTWHHWMNLNLTGIEADADQTNWDKISRYFINIATWLAPPGVFRSRCWWELAVTNFTAVGLQEFSPKATTFEVGSALRGHLMRTYGPCWVQQFVIDIVHEIDRDLARFLEGLQGVGPGDVCLSCPPWETIEAEILGGLVKGSRAPIERFGKAFDAVDLSDRRRRFDLSTEDLRNAGMKGAARSLKGLSRDVTRDARQVLKAFGG